MEKRSFWSSAPGLVTGVAGLLTALVALFGLLVQLGVIGDKDSSPTDAGTASEQAPGSGDSTQTTADAAPSFTVEPTSVTLDQLLAKEAKVTVKNTGETALSVQPPLLRGGDAAQFAARDLTCTAAKVPAGDTCEMTVTFTPKANGRYSGTLVVSVKGAPASAEVALRGTAVL